ncbi:hypothetical protein MPSEU_000910300 [Mayamaea pseudoterrestris]|nr:hypothetical protein MPSEU_000910300 [Mayamaea pseudoterrestris]
MNLELLNPFGRQVPDRIDSTLSLAPSLHFYSSYKHKQQQEQEQHEEANTSKTLSPEAATETTTTNEKEAAVSRKAKKFAAAAVARQAKAAKVRRKRGMNDDYITNDMDGIDEEDQEYRAAYHLQFNRRGSFLACGYGSGTLAFFSVASRSLVALYSSKCLTNEKPAATNVSSSSNDNEQLEGRISDKHETHGVTSVSWSRQSRILLSAGVGASMVRLWDNEHPFGRQQAWMGLLRQKKANQKKQQQLQAKEVAGDDNDDSDDNDDEEKAGDEAALSDKISADSPAEAAAATIHATIIHPNLQTSHSESDSPPRRRHLSHVLLQPGDTIPVHVLNQAIASATTRHAGATHDSSSSWAQSPLRKHPCVSFDFDLPIGGPVQTCPRCPTGGLAVLSDGSLVLFWVPKSAFEHTSSRGMQQAMSERLQGNINTYASQSIRGQQQPVAVIVQLWNEGSSSSSSITCASFDRHGDRVYAATKNGMLLGFDVAAIWRALLRRDDWPFPTTTATGTDSAIDGDRPSDQRASYPARLPNTACHFKISLGGSTAWHLLVSRNGKYLVVNSADGALRLFSTDELWQNGPVMDRKPTWLFQDLVSKVKFVCCDLSGMDGEYLVAGANGDDNKYELYVWSTSTGALIDKLTGSPVQLYSVAWHPTRAFIAVATSDGLIDVWGPKMDWTAFAPDFQMLPANVEYVEEEDEFDVDADGRFLSEEANKQSTRDNETDFVDVLNVEKVPVFASDSEGEEEVFNFETTLCSTLVRPTCSLPSGLEE